MKRSLILAAALAFAVAPSFAETAADVETVPIEHPVATYVRPSGWSSYPDDNGVTTVSADGKVSVSTILVTANDLGAAEKFASSWYAQRRVKLDPASWRTPPHRSIGQNHRPETRRKGLRRSRGNLDHPGEARGQAQVPDDLHLGAAARDEGEPRGGRGDHEEYTDDETRRLGR